jgi:hypothetical protein
MAATGSGQRLLSCAITALILLRLTHSAAAAQDEPDRHSQKRHKADRDDAHPSDGPRPQRGFQNQFDSSGSRGDLGRRDDSPLEITVEKGYCFINGEYIAPPYEVRCDAEKLTVNGREISCKPPQREFGGRGFGGGFGPRGSDLTLRYFFSQLHGQLALDFVIISFESQPFVSFDTSHSYDLLKSLIVTSKRALRQVTMRNQLPADFNRDVWDEWISGFQPPDDLKIRAAAFTNAYEQNQEHALADIRTQRLLEKLAYPLSVSGMVLSVLAIGHLLGGRPHAGKPTKGLDPSPEMIQALNWSIAFAAALSILDLVWTILATSSSTSGVTELNPIGKELIHDPRNLAGFKIAITFSCLALLWLMRKHKRAQIAAWWLCLVLTLVTCRWLVVDSLMMTSTL